MLRRADLQLDDAVITACTKFRQGSIVRNVAVSFTANILYRITPIARDQITERNDIVRVGLPLAIITLPSCDLQNAKRIAIRPFVSVARVFDARTEFDKGYIGRIAAGRVGDLIQLTGPQFAGAAEFWVADLRLEGTIERGVLVGKEPLDAFPDDAGYFLFQRKLSAIRGRNAVDDRVRQYILNPLRLWLESDTERSELIEEIRIRALPTILAANSVELFFLTVDAADPAEVQDKANEWYTARSALLPGDLRLLDISVIAISSFTRADEIGTERLDLDDLSERG